MSDCRNSINGNCITNCLCLQNKIKSLESKLAEAESMLAFTTNTASGAIKDLARCKNRLAVAVEVLEFINTYKSPDYVNLPRGSVFDVSREALKQLSK